MARAISSVDGASGAIGAQQQVEQLDAKAIGGLTQIDAGGPLLETGADVRCRGEELATILALEHAREAAAVTVVMRSQPTCDSRVLTCFGESDAVHASPVDLAVHEPRVFEVGDGATNRLRGKATDLWVGEQFCGCESGRVDDVAGSDDERPQNRPSWP